MMQAITLSTTSVKFEGSKLLFEAVAITDEFVPQQFMSHLLETARNKEIRWRHVSPDNQIESYLGRVLDARLQRNGQTKLIINGEILGDTTEQQTAQKLVREMQARGEPLGISMGLIETRDPSGRLMNVEARESSVTPSPKCDSCRITAIKNEKEGERQTVSSTAQTPQANIQPAVNSQPIDLNAKIKELEEKLAKALKEKDAVIEYMKEIGALDSEKMKKLEHELEIAKTLPLRKEVGTLAGLEGQALEARIKQLEPMAQMNLEVMRDMLATARSLPKIPMPQQVVSATASLQELDLTKASDEEKAKFADEYARRYSKRTA